MNRFKTESEGVIAVPRSTLCLAAVFVCFGLLLVQETVVAKEVALSFDDVPKPDSLHFVSSERTRQLIQQLNELTIQAIIFANPCNGDDLSKTLKQIKNYKDQGHVIGNHTCTHPRLDAVGHQTFTEDILKAERLLSPLVDEKRFFRFPFLNEGTKEPARNRMRRWLSEHGYFNATITGDNEDPTFSAKINEAKKLKKRINYSKVRDLFVDHIVSSLECLDDLAVATIGRSPKHVLLLHEADATVMFIEPLVKQLRSRGWSIISPLAAYQDQIYSSTPSSTHSGYGLIAQMAHDKTGQKTYCYDYSGMVRKLNQLLDLN